MAISQLCNECGADLGRVRARRDPHYGLPLVMCPYCSTAAVRRRHPTAQRWRELKRLSVPLSIIILQLAALSGLLSLVAVVCFEFGDKLDRAGIHLQHPDGPIILGLALCALPIAVGAWLTAGLHHWRRWAAWCLFTFLAVLTLSFDCLVGPAITQGSIDLGLSVGYLECDFEIWRDRMLILVAMMIVASIGIPVGKLLMWGFGHTRRRLWRARRKRLRARRVAL